MGAFIEDHLVVEDGQLYPQRTRGTVALMWVVSCHQGRAIWDRPKLLSLLLNAREI